MAVLDLVQGQPVQIPAILLSDGQPLTGVARATQGDTVSIELVPGTVGLIPPKVDGNCVLTWKNDGVQRACPIVVRSSSPRAMVVQAVIPERREAPRLKAEVRLSYEVIPPEMVASVAQEVMARVNPLGEPVCESARLLRLNREDPLEQIRQEIAGLRATMEIMMARLEQLTEVVTSGKPRTARVAKKPLAIVNCSSTGVGFLTDEPYEEGQYLRLHLTLVTAPQVEIDCMGVVVRGAALEAGAGEGSPRRYDTGVRYTHIHESDREHLIHYLFKVQRRMLRDLKEARDEMG